MVYRSTRERLECLRDLKEGKDEEEASIDSLELLPPMAVFKSACSLRSYRLSQEVQQAWRVRAESLNRRRVPGVLTKVPRVIQVDLKSNVRIAIND